jgi:hypothetical protein
MGFLDKAKKLAEQAQTKIDEVQKDFNAKQAGEERPQGDPVVEYDHHGRRVAQDEPTSPDPAPTRPHGDPLQTGEDASRHGADADRGERPGPPPPPAGGNPGMTSGDPLGG